MTKARIGGHRPALTTEELEHTVKVYRDWGSNKMKAAKALGITRQGLQDRLKDAVTRIGFEDKPLVDGRIGEVEPAVRPLPAPGKVAHYIGTSLQNNTHLHPAWNNLLVYRDWLAALGPAELMVGTFSYDLASYGKKAVKRGAEQHDKDEGLWYAPEAEPYFMDGPVELAPALRWCGQMNILPTAVHPLSGLDTYNGRRSNIVPHVKQALESIPSMPDEGTKLNLSTGTIGQRNYIQKNAGIKAEQAHHYGAVLVQVNSAGDWWVRHLRIDEAGAIYDIAPRGLGAAVRIADGVVTVLDSGVEAIVWGDAHTAEMEAWVRELAWGPGGMLDELEPRQQIVHDIFSMRSRGHHEMKDFHSLYRKMVAGVDSVEAEVLSCAEWLRYAARPEVDTIVIPSNHDRHLSRWLNDEDPRKDLINARYHAKLQVRVLERMDARDASFNVLAYALGMAGLLERVRFLEEDESLVICKGGAAEPGGIECGLHGDRGPGGARGTTRNLARLSRAVIKGHDHTATIRDNVYSVGACSLEFPYMRGPSSHSVTHCVVFENGARQLVTMWKGKWRA